MPGSRSGAPPDLTLRYLEHERSIGCSVPQCYKKILDCSPGQSYTGNRLLSLMRKGDLKKGGCSAHLVGFVRPS
jgi:hypothetical protein